MLRCTWIGHSTVALEGEYTTLLVDPLLRMRVGPLVRTSRPLVPYADRIDGVLLTHLHADHVDLPSLRPFTPPRTHAPVVAPHDAVPWLESHDVRVRHGVEEGDEVRVGAATVRAVHADHPGSFKRIARPCTPLGYVVELAGIRVWIVGDSDPMEDVAERVGPVDLALMPISGWGPTLGRGHMDGADAARMARLVEARLAIPVHYRTYVMPLVWPVVSVRWRRELLRFTEGLAGSDTELRVLDPGEHLDVTPRGPGG